MGSLSRLAAVLGVLAIGAGGSLFAQTTWIPRSVLRDKATGVDPHRVQVVRGNQVDSSAVITDRGVPIKRGEVVVVPATAAPSRDSSAGETSPHVDLPNRYFVLGPDGRLLTLRLRVSFSGRGLRYDPSIGAFVGEIIVGLEDSLRQSEQVPLSAPIQVQVTGEADGFDPSDFPIQHTNLPYARIKVRANSPKDTIQIVVQPTFDPAGVRTPIPVFRSPLQIRVSPTSIQGFGLQSAAVTIRMTDAPEGGKLQLWTTKGGLDADTLTFGAGGLAVTRVRSQGIGRATVHAELGLIAAGMVPIDYTVPWTFFVAAVLGGGVGAFIRRRREDTKEKASKADLPLGIAGGFLGAVAYALGINLFGLDLSVRIGEAATFLAAAFSAALDLPGLAGVRAKFASAKP